MKKLAWLSLIVVFGISCKNSETPEIKIVETETAKPGEDAEELATAYNTAGFTIEGMTCAIGCAATIEKNLAAMDGVKSAKVDFETKTALVEYNPLKIGLNDLTATVISSGDGKTYKVVEGKDGATVKSCENECCKGKTEEEKANCPLDCCLKKKKDLAQAPKVNMCCFKKVEKG